jgi:hypothetical protein
VRAAERPLDPPALLLERREVMFNRFNLDKKERVRRDEMLAKLRAIPKEASHEEGTPLVIEAFRGVGYNVWAWFDEGPGWSQLAYTNETNIFARVRTVRNSPAHGGVALFAALNEKPKKVRKS